MSGPLTCARCQWPLRAASSACPACAAPHCPGCAALGAGCARPGCAGRFPPGPLPPLAVLARSAESWPAREAPPAGAVLVLLPTPRAARERVEAALVVGELLGAGPEEGQRRLAGGHPEPLLLTEAGPAEGAAARLAAVGLPACVLPAAEVARPLQCFDVTALVPGDPWQVRDGEGRTRRVALAAPRLVVSADLVEVRAAPEGQSARTATGRHVAEAVGLIHTEPGASPLLLRARVMRGVPGLAAAAPLARRLGQVLGQLAAPPGRGVVLEGSRAPALLVPRGEDLRHNLPALLLAARLLEGAWRAGRLPEHVPAIDEVAW